MSLRRVAPFLVALFVSSAFGQDFKKQVIYQIITDRFFSGSTSNDNPSQSSGFPVSFLGWNGAKVSKNFPATVNGCS